MADRLVSVDENFNLQPAVARRQAERLGDSATPEGAALKGAVSQQVQESTASMIGGVGVKRILTTKNVEEAVQDGDLVLVLETPRLFTDFSQYATGVAPSDWTSRWVADTFTVEAATDATGGKVLRHTSTAQARRALSWNAADAEAARTGDVETVFKWRASGQGGVRTVLRGSATAGAEIGVGIGHNDSNGFTVINPYTGSGAPAQIGSKPYPYTANTWYITRARAYGNKVYARTWPASEPEPSTWAVSADNATVNKPGWVGALAFGVGAKEYDWFGVAFDGGRAPRQAV